MVRIFCQRKHYAIYGDHDRFFLERVCNEIIELDNGKLYSYKGNYSYYLEKRRAHASENSSVDKAQNLVKELEWMRRQLKARTTKSNRVRKILRD
jgi:ATP-binding cassette subfamily F protein uup